MKKSISILMALFFLITTIAVNPVFAAPIPEAQTFVENFESAHFNSNKFSSDSEIFNDGGWTGTYYASTEGYNGGTDAIKIAANSDKTGSNLQTKKLDVFGLSATSPLVYNIRFKFLGKSAAGFEWRTDPSSSSYISWYIRGNEAGFYHFTDTNSPAATATLSDGNWYNLSVKLTTDAVQTYIYDESGKLIVSTSKASANLAKPADNYFIFRFTGLTTDGILFDDAKLYCVNATDYLGFDAAASTAPESVISTDGSLTLKFDQTVNPTVNMFTVKDSNNATVENVIDSIDIIDYNTVKVNFDELAKGTAYTLDFSSVVSAGGSALSGDVKSLSFKTEKAKLFVENFESAHFNSNKFSSDSEIFNDGGWTGTYYASTEGYNGGTDAIKIAANSDKTGSNLQTKKLDVFGLSATSPLVYNIRFKFLGKSAAGFEWRTDPSTSSYISWYIRGNEDGFYYFTSTQAPMITAKLMDGIWYNMSVKITTDAVHTSIYDENGNNIATCLKDSPNLVTPASNYFIFRFTGLTTDGILFDDAKMYCVEATDTVSLVNTSIENGDEVATDGSIEFTFNAPITATEDMFTIDGGAAIKDVKVKNFNTAVVSFTGLKKGELTYNLSFAGLKSAGGSALSSESVSAISFKTPVEDFKVEKVSGEIVSGNVAKDSEIKVSVKNQTTAEAANVSVIFAIKKADGTLIAAGIGGTKAIGASNTVEYSFIAADDYSDVDRIEVFTLDALTTLKPLANVFEIE